MQCLTRVGQAAVRAGAEAACARLTCRVSGTHTGVSALIAVDVQASFEPGGALAVADGDGVVGPLIAVMSDVEQIVLSRDYHPAGHISFTARGGRWPAHCVQGTTGAELDQELRAAAVARGGYTMISKGADPDRDAYSAFDGAGADGRALDQVLRDAGVGKLLVGGLATDYCVRATVLDALKLGYGVHVLADAVRAVDATPGDGVRALEEMRRAGARVARH